VPIREVIIPVKPGRNTSAIIEIAARHELLRQAGYDASKSFLERVDDVMRQGPPSSLPGITGMAPRDGEARVRQPALESSVPPPVKKPRGGSEQ
jgi:HPr kinase/phosphorylase